MAIGLVVLIGAHVFAGFGIHHSFHTSLPVVVLGGLAYLLVFYFYGVKRVLKPYEVNIEAFTNEVAKKLNLQIRGIPVVQL